MSAAVPDHLEATLYEGLLAASVSEKHATLVARVCVEEVERKSKILDWCLGSDLKSLDFGKVVVAVYLEDDLDSRSELNSPQISELRTAAYGVYDRWR
jgi:hypothetical protein